MMTRRTATRSKSTMMISLQSLFVLLSSAFVICCSSASAAAVSVSASAALAEVQQQQQKQQQKQQQHEQQQKERELQTSLDEPSRCIPLEELIAGDSRFISATNGAVDSQCLAYNGCTMSRSSCCRVNLNLAWLVCDPNNSFASAGLPCVCSDITAETSSPTITPSPTDPPTMPAPTMQPTTQPTQSPTMPPTAQPTLPPTVQPTPAPVVPTTAPTTMAPTTAPLTQQPTAAPTLAPITLAPTTMAPTTAPLTQQPTAVPTLAPITPAPTTAVVVTPTLPPLPPPTLPPTQDNSPSSFPSQEPTKGPPFETREGSIQDSTTGNTVRVLETQCDKEPPELSLVQSSTYEYRYSVNIVDNGSTEQFWVQDLSTNIHENVVDEFFDCKFKKSNKFDEDDPSSIVVLQDQVPHQVVRRCSSGDDSLESTGVECWVVQAKGSLQVYAPSLGAEEEEEEDKDDKDEDDRRVLRAGSSRKIRGQKQHQQGSKNKVRGRRSLQASEAQIFADEVMTHIRTAMLAGEFSDETVINVALDDEWSSTPAPVPTSPPTEGSPPASTGGQDEPVPGPPVLSPTQAPGSVSSNAIEQQPTGDDKSSGDSDGLATPFIAAIAVASVFVVLLAVMTLTRRRRRQRQASEDASNDDPDKEYLRSADENDAAKDLGIDDEPNTSGESAGEVDGEGGDYPMPYIATSLSQGGVGDDDDDSFTSTKKSVRTPSRRSKRGPLCSQDELSVAGTLNTTPISPSIIESQRSPRGSPPSPRGSPREYSLQDTVNL
mmetsp:Transcript_11865/g.28468  ORF Transcript_11865/g.28468 Transcript_11865/m.28468 type:complete len:771 (+) Transcript_11865:464-2776(+)